MGLRNKDLISIHDLSVGEVATILDVAKKLKRKQKRGEPHRYLEGKTLAMIFQKLPQEQGFLLKPVSISLADILFILMIPLRRLAAVSRCVIRQGCFPVLLTAL